MMNSDNLILSILLIIICKRDRKMVKTETDYLEKYFKDITHR